jgi:hypothetical protein
LDILALLKLNVLNKVPSYKELYGNAGIASSFSTRWRCVVSFTPWPLYLQIVWVGPKGSLDDIEKRKLSFLCQESNRDPSVIQSLACSLYRLSYPDSLES